MKILTHLMQAVRNRTILALVGLALLSTISQAATFDLWVYARGQWALVVPGSNTGGRLIWRPEYGCVITDRAVRGEYMEVDIFPSTAAEYGNPYIARCWLSSTAGSRNLQPVSPTMYTWVGFTVPTSPSWDNNHVNVTTASGTFSIRIPVGGNR